MASLGIGWKRAEGTRVRAAKRGCEGFGTEKMNERKPIGPKPVESAQTNRGKKADGKPIKLSREVQARLGQQLRAMYDEVVNQGVPDRFTELLNRIDVNENKDTQ